MAQSVPRVFLSHSSKDKDFVWDLYKRLTRDGVSCFFDAESIGWGDNWVTDLEGAIDQCEYIVYVLSPDFCESEWAKVERTSSMADDPSRLRQKVRPLMLTRCSHLPNFPRFLRQVQAIDVSTASLFAQNYPRICEDLGGVPRSDFTTPDRTKLPPVHPLPERHRMPYQSLGHKFVGRVDAIWSLYDSLFRDHTTVLQGMGVVAGAGGLGKTQLAIEYSHRFGSTYAGGVYWVDADRGLSAMITQIGDAAAAEINTKAEEQEQAEQIWRVLNSRHKPYLLILDNFPENVVLEPYLPTTGRVHTIITTRRQDLRHAKVRLPMLTAEEGVRLLNSGERQFGTAAKTLAERLGGLPLALELAKSYLNYDTDLSIPGLLEEMKSAGEIEVLAEFASEYKDQLPSRHELDVVQTFQMSWNITPDSAKRLLRVMAELAPTPVPRKLLRIILNLPESPALRDELNKSLSELARLSLVELDTAGNPIAHRLILAFLRHRNLVDDASPFDRCRQAIVQQMLRTFDNPDASTNRELELFVPHAGFLSATGRLTAEEFRDILSALGGHHRTMGRFIPARNAFSEALASDEKAFEPGHPSIAIRQSNLALVLKDLGQLEEARDLLGKALTSNEKSLEPGHPSMARIQSNLAAVLKGLGQLEEARDLLRKALAASLERHGPDHPATKIFQSNLDGLPGG